jgi:glycine/D-amino acid oxidase-like deaminating enzyme
MAEQVSREPDQEPELAIDQRWDVAREPGDEFALAGSVKPAGGRLEEEAREAAFTDFTNARFAGAWAPRTDLSTRPAAFVVAYKAELERLEAERVSRRTAAARAATEGNEGQISPG